MTQNIFEVIKKDGRFSILTKILERTGIGDTLSNQKGVLTFFAPTDEAFSKLPKDELERLSGKSGGKLIADILGRHIVPNAYFYTEDLRQRDSVEALDGIELKIAEKEKMLQLEGEPVLTPGILSRNGVIFAVNTVLPYQQMEAENIQQIH
ncbi:MAG: fasciclin domain-containing protein [Acidobacteriota bacterium]|nr:fasciclin domain-containing protein [Acidobacteriota bacterium]